ncbi:hypothetical protein FRB94_003895 [Tulasnella sp. JGI-2019a]|nr:hypothetical protein FRB93_009220 [Tulasnella sp. JGI-2019a]KAG9013063.1 hypothetical protein FRB94_003895 [Tulasnella sp. JGI-2019a]KAG9025725.1 hypothetical protein FRB95_009840 [Tulasnella sp. JGI-2019a]
MMNVNMSSAPISIAHHTRRLSSLGGSAFAPWLASSVMKCAPLPAQTTTEEAAAQMHHHSSPSFSFLASSPNDVSASLRAKGVYDATKLEQEHCTGYECCNVKLGDMHAVMDHFEVAHRQSRLGHLPAQPTLPRAQVFRHQSHQQSIITPVLLPVLPVLSTAPRVSIVDDYDVSSSAPSPCPSSTTCSDRSRGSFSEDGLTTEFAVDLEVEARLPQTPPAMMHNHAGQNITIVGASSGEFYSPEGNQHGNFQQQFGGFNGQQAMYGGAAFQFPSPQKQAASSGTFFPVVQVAAPPMGNANAQYRFPEPSRPTPSERPTIHVSVSTPAIGTDADSAFTPDTPSFGGDSLYTPTTAAPSPISPMYAQQQQLQYQQQLLQPPQMQIRTPTVPALSVTTSQNHPFHHPQPHAFNAARLQLDNRPLAPSPSPSTRPQSQLEFYAQRSQQGQQMMRSDSLTSMNASLASVLNIGGQQPIATPSLYATSVKRSYDDMESANPSPLAQEWDDEDEDDEDAEGEMDVAQYHSHNYESAASTLVSPSAHRRQSPTQPKEKKAKSGRPRGNNSTRASAAKDPKRAKLFCPKEGCTKRYMNPNGLKYHLEKGTCTFDA